MKINLPKYSCLQFLQLFNFQRPSQTKYFNLKSYLKASSMKEIISWQNEFSKYSLSQYIWNSIYNRLYSKKKTKNNFFLFVFRISQKLPPSIPEKKKKNKFHLMSFLLFTKITNCMAILFKQILVIVVTFAELPNKKTVKIKGVENRCFVKPEIKTLTALPLLPITCFIIIVLILLKHFVSYFLFPSEFSWSFLHF